MKKSRNTGDILAPTILIAGLIGLWYGSVRVMNVPDWLAASPDVVARTLVADRAVLWQHTRVTLAETIIGFVIAIALAAVIAYVMDGVPRLKQAMLPLLVASQTIPIISVAPLFIIWFGYGLMPKIVTVVLVCFFPVAISLLNGLASVDQEYLDLFRSMRAGSWNTFRMVKLPMALPAFFAGLKIAASYAVMGAVIGEWLAAQSGLGLYMMTAQHAFRSDRVLAAIVVITVLSLILLFLVIAVERAVIPWNRIETE
ncbi:MAG: ABC transporter permease [Solirubrobacterales bacterium]